MNDTHATVNDSGWIEGRDAIDKFIVSIDIAFATAPLFTMNFGSFDVPNSVDFDNAIERVFINASMIPPEYFHHREIIHLLQLWKQHKIGKQYLRYEIGNILGRKYTRQEFHVLLNRLNEMKQPKPTAFQAEELVQHDIKR